MEIRFYIIQKTNFLEFPYAFLINTFSDKRTTVISLCVMTHDCSNL